MLNENLTRRTFLKVTTLAGTGVLVGCSFSTQPTLSSTTQKEEHLGLWVKISSDNQIILTVPGVEMGQGIHTAHAMILAEEMEAKWGDISVVHAPVNPEFVADMPYGFVLGQGSTGSMSIVAWWDKLRFVGAGCRDILIKAASEEWQVPSKECKAKNSKVIHVPSNKELSYGQLATKASQIDPPSDPQFKSKLDYKLVGKSIPRVDIPSKINGSLKFGTDVRIPGMLYGAISQSPIFNGKVKSFDEAAAMKIKGVENVIQVESMEDGGTPGAGVVVLADSTWHAIKGLEALKVQFEGGKILGFNSKKIEEELDATLNDIGKSEITEKVYLDEEYSVQFLSHACIEPLNCTAIVKDDICEVWAPAQGINRVKEIAIDITGLDEEKVIVHTPHIGGSFGRKQDFNYFEITLKIATKVRKPVQLVWSREQDMRGGFFRPVNKSRIQVEMGDDGMPIKWNKQLAVPSIAANFRELSPLAIFDFDPPNIGGTVGDHFAAQMDYHDFSHPYEIPNADFEYSNVDLGIPVGPWRAVGHVHNTFYVESAIDEIAHKVNQDPLDYRLKLLANKPRHTKVMQLLAKKASWGKAIPKNHGRGIAMGVYMSGIAAQAIEISVNNRGKLKVERVDCVIDCGRYVNPDIIKSQVEGGIIMGLSSTISEKITVEKGQVVQGNFDEYKIIRMKDIPEINIHLIESNEKPGGIGETGNPPVAPALTNAIFAATGKRIRKLPIGKQKLV